MSHYLSHVLTPGEPVWPGDPAVEREQWAELAADGYSLSRIAFGEHAGTHLGAPSHYGYEPDIASFPETLLTGSALVLRFGAEPRISATAMSCALQKAGATSVEGNSQLVLISTGWAARWGSPGYFDGEDGVRVPGLTEDGLLALLDAVDPAIVAIDGPNIDHGGAAAGLFECGREIARRGKFHLENVARVPPKIEGRCRYLLAPLRIAGGTGSPCLFVLTENIPANTDHRS